MQSVALHGISKKCQFAGEVVGSKKSDGLYYILHVEVVHSFNEIIKACRKYYGYRLAIARDKTTFDTMLSLQYTDGGELTLSLP